MRRFPALSSSSALGRCRSQRTLKAAPSTLSPARPQGRVRSKLGCHHRFAAGASRSERRRLAEWRRDAPIRPVVFEDAGVLTEDTVHLHLEQRVAQRLLARFRAQGFIYHDLSRACLAQTADSVPRVILLGRLSLYGQQAERLHEELVPVAARWVEPSQRKGPLQAYARDTEERSLELLERSLGDKSRRMPSEAVLKRLLAAAVRDIEDLLPQLSPRAEELAAAAEVRLDRRGEKEARELRETLENQRKRVQEQLAKYDVGVAAATSSTSERRRCDNSTPTRGIGAAVLPSSRSTSRRSPSVSAVSTKYGLGA